jgi:hypothetical protein
MAKVNCSKCATHTEDFPHGDGLCSSCRVEQAKCAHFNTVGAADWAGTKIVFTCTKCGKKVKTITNETPRIPLSKHPIHYASPFQKDITGIWDNADAMEEKPTVPIHSNLKGYYRRALNDTSGGVLEDGKPMWKYEKWGDTITAPTTVEQVSQKIKSWAQVFGPKIEYAVVRCLGCNLYHNQADWSGTHCPACSGKGTVNIEDHVKPSFVKVKKVTPPMKNGEVRKLPKSNSPMWTTQWTVQGTAKAPYVVSRTVNPKGSTTAEGWACSCPNFTQHSPRTECKHILKVMLSEGVKPSAAPVALMPEDQQEAFQKFLRQQAAAGTPALPAGASKPLFTTGRKFR